jgi:hypothetical protein
MQLILWTSGRHNEGVQVGLFVTSKLLGYGPSASGLGRIAGVHVSEKMKLVCGRSHCQKNSVFDINLSYNDNVFRP